MAKIVLGIAASHTPLLTLDSPEWEHRADADRANPALNLSDGRLVNYGQLLAEVGPRYEEAARPEELARKWQLTEDCLERLADALAEARPDVVLIVGDDQGELFGPANQPAFAVFHADQMPMSDMYGPDKPAWVHKMGRGYMMDARHMMRGHREFALTVLQGLVEEGVDATSVAQVLGTGSEGAKGGLGHAFGFIVKRLFRGREIPVAPLLLNTYYPPNVPTPSRCVDIGRALRRVLEAEGGDARVAIIASGGLSHFVVDEELDRRVLDALATRNTDVLRQLRRGELNSGSSEILNWVLAAGALEGLDVVSSEYLPLYRTPAGTGVGAGFVIWKEQEERRA